MKTITFNEQSKEKFEKNYVVIYHAHCSDGIFAAASALVGMTSEVRVGSRLTIPTDSDFEKLPMISFAAFDYGIDLEIDHLLDENTTLFFVDVSITDLDMVKSLCSKVETLVSLDHHDDTLQFCLTNILELPDNYQNLNSKVRAGSWLSWDYFMEGVKQPQAIVYADDRDRWSFQNPNTKAFHEYVVANVLSQNGIKDKLRAAISVLDNENAVVAVQQGSQIIKYRDALIDDILEQRNSFQTFHAGKERRFGVIVAPYKLISESCAQAFERYPNTDVMVAVHFDQFGNYGYSFRCLPEREDELRVNEIAKKFGGGGHRAASGASNIGNCDFVTQLKENI